MKKIFLIVFIILILLIIGINNKVEASETKLKVGEEQTLTLSDAGTLSSISWKTSNSSIVSCTPKKITKTVTHGNGRTEKTETEQTKTATIKGVSAGTATITVSYTQKQKNSTQKKSKTWTITVLPNESSGSVTSVSQSEVKKVDAFSSSSLRKSSEDKCKENQLRVYIQQGNFVLDSGGIDITPGGESTKEINFKKADYVKSYHLDGRYVLRQSCKYGDEDLPIYVFFYLEDTELYDNSNHSFSVSCIGANDEDIEHFGISFDGGGHDAISGYAKIKAMDRESIRGTDTKITIKIKGDRQYDNTDLTVKIDVDTISETKMYYESLVAKQRKEKLEYTDSNRYAAPDTYAKNKLEGLMKELYESDESVEETQEIEEASHNFKEVEETGMKEYENKIISQLTKVKTSEDEIKYYIVTGLAYRNIMEDEYIFKVSREDKTEEYKNKETEIDENRSETIIIDEEIVNDANNAADDMEEETYDVYVATVLSSYASGYRASAPFKDVLEFIGDYKPDDMDPDTSGKVEEISSKVLSVVTNIGMVVTILIIALLGIKYMLGSVEEKAEYKKDLVPVLIGALLLFGVVAFVKIFMELGIQISNV